MGLYLYCVVPETRRPEDGLAGLDERPVRAHPRESLAAWVTELDARPEPTLERIRRHNDVIEAAITEAVTPIPIRFGQWLDEPESVDDWLAAHGDGYRHLLDELGGCLEWGVRVADPAAEPAPQPARTAASGREYLEALAEREGGRGESWRRGRALADALAEELGGLVRGARAAPLPSAHGLVSIAHLVARPDFRRYRAGLDAFRLRHPELRFLVSGPWPPYTFVE